MSYLTQNEETEEQKVHRAVYAIGNAHRFSEWYGAYRRPSGRIKGLEDATVVVEKTLSDSRGEARGYDGEYDQGSEGEIGIIFKVTFDDGTVFHLKKVGYQDSYGANENWDGPFRLGVPKTVIVYE